ncbi:hypothetical protein EG329_013314 [Mollisiaceae sp. DMI_Dod_QoI]|nr:hypothetical protein EG329_013314 [Helotiales sp. DMI_Dod_QoI]
MFKIVTSSPRLALLRSHAGTSLRLLHQTAIRAENSPQGIPPKKTPRRRATQQATSEVETNHDTVYEVESSSTPKVLKRRRARKVEPEATKSTIFEFESSDAPKVLKSGRKHKAGNGEVPEIPNRRYVRKKVPADIAEDESKTTLKSSLKKDKVLRGNIRDSDNVLKALTRAYRGAAARRGLDKSRMNVISESLCDDSIERLKPSLEQYKGCDIIDINPGAGVWSSKLHDHLQPRTHILMEPDEATYGQLLQPLLDEPGSKYTLIPQSGIMWAQLEKILSKKYLPHQDALSHDDPRLNEPNTTLLVVANLGLEPKKSYRGFTSLAQMVVYQFLSAIKAHSLFHRYGLIRMLIWVNDDEKFNVLPRTVFYRRKSAIEMEISCPNVAEIASSTSKTPTGLERDPAIDAEGLQQVLKRMGEKGIKIPPGRESILMDEVNQGSTQLSADFKTRPNTDAKVKTLGQELLIDENGIPLNPDRAKLVEYKSALATQKSLRKKVDKMRIIVADYMEIVALQKRIFNEGTSKGEEPLREELVRQYERWTEIFHSLPKATERNEVLLWLDNILAFHDQLLIWDRRESEPLRAHANEFYPPKEMALFDLQPSSQWPILREDYPQNDEVLEYILAQLLPTPTQSTKRGIRSLCPGALEWLTENCPSLTNPNKGGCEDLDLLPVRRLSRQMLREILEAWAKWPWKPTRWDIVGKLGSEQYDPDSIEKDD